MFIPKVITMARDFWPYETGPSIILLFSLPKMLGEWSQPKLKYMELGKGGVLDVAGAPPRPPLYARIPQMLWMLTDNEPQLPSLWDLPLAKKEPPPLILFI